MHYYKDRPDKIEEWIKTLTDDEQAIFDAGYLIALQGLLEQIVESKRKILNRMLDIDEKGRKLLESRLYLLDVYEKTYETRVQTLASNQSKQLTS